MTTRVARRAQRSAAFGLAALVALVACERGKATLGALPSGAVPVASVPLPAPALPLPPYAMPGSFADLVGRADPGVVFVKTTLRERRVAPGRRVLGQALGSAFVYDANGLILTNNHVIEGASDIEVIVGHSRVLSATVVGRDRSTDVALLRVDATGLPALPLGDSDAVRVGDWVIAIGNPFGLSHTVSAGIVSAKDRTNQELRQNGGGLDEAGYYDFLQTDASINPGNSGGPLLDVTGRVVGINTAIRENSNGIGFAIPINMVREILPRLLKDGKIRRSAVGVSVVSIEADDITRLGLAAPEGALVSVVVPGGPAERAGLAVDDVVLAFEGKPVTGPEQLRWKASLAGVGTQVTLRVARGRRQFDLKVKLGELPAQRQAPSGP